MTLVALAVSPDGYEIRTRHESLRVTLTSRGRAFQLRFPGRWRAVAKGKLVKRLLAKQFEPFVPRPRIRLRRTR
ncbi:MAG: hypothetical protein ACSLFE_04245 [Gemmatimonadaceae bacterium]